MKLRKYIGLADKSNDVYQYQNESLQNKMWLKYFDRFVLSPEDYEQRAIQ